MHPVLHIRYMGQKEQESGFRAGTLAVHNIVGFGKAAEIALRDMEQNKKHIKRLDDLFLHKIRDVEGIRPTVASNKRISGIINLIVDKGNFHNERFIKKVSEDVALSTGSACSAGEPSYVIQALGQQNMVSKVLRVSINKFTTEEDIKKFVEVLKKQI